MSTLALPAPPAARAPAEAGGRSRADVAMLVTTRGDEALLDARFRDLPSWLRAGDVLVVNDSATLPAALPARLAGAHVELRLSTPLPDGTWAVELRAEEGSPLRRPPVPSEVALPGGARAELLSRHLGSERLSVARFDTREPLPAYLGRHGHPIRYAHVPESWPLATYQTVFARTPGSAEMPSAGRPFTAELVTELVTRGVLVAPLTLHAGVSSPERGEPPFPEPYEVRAHSAWLINAARWEGGRAIAIGTTAVRALETVADPAGRVVAGRGFTDLVITPERGLRAIDGILTGWHESESSHLMLLEAATGRELLERSYEAATARGHTGHEFGDVNLILP